MTDGVVDGVTNGDMLQVSDASNDNTELAEELAEAGFQSGEVESAFTWLDELVNLSEKQVEGASCEKAIRYYQPREKASIPLEARSLLMRLERSGVLDFNSREIVIDRILALNLADLDVEHVKWVVMMVLCNQIDYPEAIEWAEGVVTETYLPVH